MRRAIPEFGLGFLVVLLTACAGGSDASGTGTPTGTAVTTTSAAPATTAGSPSTTEAPPVSSVAVTSTTESAVTTIAPTSTTVPSTTTDGMSTGVTTVPEPAPETSTVPTTTAMASNASTTSAPTTTSSAPTTTSPAPTTTEAVPATSQPPYDNQPYLEAVDAFVASSANWLAAPAIGDCMASSSGLLPASAKDLIVAYGVLGALNQLGAIGTDAIAFGQVWSGCMAAGEQAAAAGQSGPGTGSATACPGSLTALPVARDKIMGVVPLGHLAPPSHTQSTDHVYFLLPGYLEQVVESVPVVAPADGSVVKLSNYTSDYTGALFTDWQVEISTCTDGTIKFGHLSTLTGDLLALTEGPAKSCKTYGYAGYMHDSCTWMGEGVDFALSAGDLIGTAGGLGTPNSQLDLWALDWGGEPAAAIDPSAQPESILRAQCPLDWFTPDLRDYLYSIRMESNGILADDAVGCGKVFQDVAGAAKGFWYSVTPIDGKWLNHLALVDDNVRSDHQAVSVAALVANPGYWIFQKQSTGNVNRDFAQVAAGSGIYCYDTFTADSNGPSGTTDRFLIEVVDDETLHIEHQNGTCSGSLSFSNPYQYSRFEN